MDWLKAHAKFIPAAVAAVLVIFLDDATAQGISAAVGAVLTYLVPNDPVAVARVYHRDRPR
jgi:hypothetical protein